MSFQDLILNKNWLKVASLALAALIWFAINTNLSHSEMRLSQNPLRLTDQRDFRAPVMVMTSATNRRLFQIEPLEVRVTVSGDPGIVDKLTPDEIRVLVNLVDVADVQGTFRLEAKVPPEINPREVVISPDSVQVKTYADPAARPEPLPPR